MANFIKLSKLCFLLLIKLSISSYANVSLQIDVDNSKELEGVLFLELYKLPETIPNNLEWQDLAPIRQVSEPLKENTHSIKINNLENGEYSIQLFIDENANQVLDSSKMGLPLEAIGFSNNPIIIKGKPRPIDTFFSLSKEKTNLDIFLKKKKKRRRKKI